MYKNYEEMANAFEGFMIPENGESVNEGFGAAVAAAIWAPFVIGGVAVAGTLLSNAIGEAKRKRKLSQVRLHEIINSIADKAKEVEYPEGLLDITNRYIKEYLPIGKKMGEIRSDMIEDFANTETNEWSSLKKKYDTKYHPQLEKLVDAIIKLNGKTTQEVSSLNKDNVSNDRSIFQVIRNFYDKLDETGNVEGIAKDASKRMNSADYDPDENDLENCYKCAEIIGLDYEMEDDSEYGFNMRELATGGLMDPILSVLKVKFK